ncbi:hypothetical protein M011DRAFT_479879 [Sporormia fimetaria CBS 119925]|uniref:Uncharacterized protein n=1 Tax=Sporormia fimetaria CBS 119925 TaxID=1340428 RepID=A0A6A6V5J6_9PLEO|nr:hypothetical protein M011DRAFT_479879 [Sporormia fimetaria CBS 119925]
MSYLIDFPPSNSLPGIRSSPPAIFAIQNKLLLENRTSVTVPSGLALHHFKKMKEWVVPAPSNLPPPVQLLAQSRSVVWINIPLALPEQSLKIILFRLKQLSGHPCAGNDLILNPNIGASVSLIRTWRLLELPPEGLRGIKMRMWSLVSMGPPITLSEMQALWTSLPRNFPVLVEMANNVMRSLIEGLYLLAENVAIFSWICENQEKDLLREIKTPIR